jgi:hypothetical protein
MGGCRKYGLRKRVGVPFLVRSSAPTPRRRSILDFCGQEDIYRIAMDLGFKVALGPGLELPRGALTERELMRSCLHQDV